MSIVAILAVFAFGIVLCVAEIPKMLKQKLYRELLVFLILLASGMILAVLKSLAVEIPNPSDFIAWIYSPFSEVMKFLTK